MNSDPISSFSEPDTQGSDTPERGVEFSHGKLGLSPSLGGPCETSDCRDEAVETIFTRLVDEPISLRLCEDHLDTFDKREWVKVS